MINNNLSIVFFSSNDFTIPIVKKLLDHNLKLLVTTNPNGRLAQFCKNNGVEIINARSKNEIIKYKSSIINCDLGVLASYGVLIPNEIVNGMPLGMINIHPSLLPKWKGPSPVQFTILNNDATTGVTLIKMDEQFDHGPILSQQKFDLSGNETSEELLDILFEKSASMIDELVLKLENGEQLTETPQDHSKETWSEQLTRESGKVDLSKIPTDPIQIKNFKLKINRMIRAFYRWPGVWLVAELKGIQTRIKLLPNNLIQPEGKNSMSYKDFINGYGEEGKKLLGELVLL